MRIRAIRDGRSPFAFNIGKKMQIIQNMKKYSKLAVPLAVIGSFSLPAHAEIDLTAITGAFSASDITVAVLAVAGVLATIYATMTAAKLALRWIRGG